MTRSLQHITIFVTLFFSFMSSILSAQNNLLINQSLGGAKYISLPYEHSNLPVNGYVLGVMEGFNHIALSSKDQQISYLNFEKFMYWINNFFLSGYFRQYIPGIYQAGRTQKTNIRRIGDKRQGSISIKKPQPVVMKTKRRRRLGACQERKMYNLRTSVQTISEGHSHQLTMEELKIFAQQKGVDWESVIGDDPPDDYVSDWGWNVISWINEALKTANTRTNSDLDSILSHYDEGLPAVAKGFLATMFSQSAPSITEQHRLMTTLWMEYMMLEHKVDLDWRSWAQTPITGNGCSKEIPHPKYSEEPTQKINSNAIRQLINELSSMSGDSGFMATSFRDIFYDDIFFAVSVEVTLSEFFNHSKIPQDQRAIVSGYLDYWLKVHEVDFQWFDSLHSLKIDLLLIPNIKALASSVTPSVGVYFSAKPPLRRKTSIDCEGINKVILDDELDR